MSFSSQELAGVHLDVFLLLEACRISFFNGERLKSLTDPDELLLTIPIITAIEIIQDIFLFHATRYS